MPQDFPRFVAALAKLRRDGNDFSFWLYGGGRYNLGDLRRGPIEAPTTAR
jgi:hypothetical protein